MAKHKQMKEHGDLPSHEKKHLHKKLRHPKGDHKKNHMGPARNHKHLDGVRHHHAGEHSPKTLPLGNLGGDHPDKKEMSMAKKKSARREKRLENVPM